MISIKLIVSLCFLVNIICLQNDFTIMILDQFNQSSDILPLNFYDDNLIILTGNPYQKYILFFNESLRLYQEKSYGLFFNYSEAIKATKNYIIITTPLSIVLYDMKKFEVIQNIKTSYISTRRALKNFNSNYWYASFTDAKQLKVNIMFIDNDYGITLRVRKEINIDVENAGSISCVTIGYSSHKLVCAFPFSGNSVKKYFFTEELNYINKTSKTSFIFKQNGFFKLFNYNNLDKFIFIACVNDIDLVINLFLIKNPNTTIDYFEDINGNIDGYLLFKNIQNDGDFSFNDAIQVNVDKIIKIYAKEKIIVTIIKLYNNNKIVSVKNYIINKFDKDYAKLMNPRLEEFNGALVVGLLVNKNAATSYWNPAIFFIGYEKKHKELVFNNNNNIKISDLISVENNIYPRLFFKILDISENFTFTNFLADEKSELNVGTYLDIKDEIVFKKYRKNFDAYILFSPFIIDDEYSSFQIMPKDTEISSELKYIEGEKRQISIRINDCNNGFHEIELYENICIKDKPEGYYLDEKLNMFRKCHPLCADCEFGSNDDSNMNCLNCKDGYILQISNCVSKDVTDKIITVDRKNSNLFVLFIVIFFAAVIISCFSVFRGIVNKIYKNCKKKDGENQNENKGSLIDLEEKNNKINKELQNINQQKGERNEIKEKLPSINDQIENNDNEINSINS